MGGNAVCQKPTWPQGQCCCNCRHRMRLMEDARDEKLLGYICLGMRELGFCENEMYGHDNETDIVYPTNEHGICELWMEKEAS